MKSAKRNDIKVKQALRAAYHAKENNGPEMSEQFEVQVMRRIRILGPIHSKPDYLSLFEQIVWRLAPVTVALIIVLATWVIQFDFGSEFEVATIFMDDPFSFNLIKELLL